MKPSLIEREVISSGSTIVGQFGISAVNQVHIMMILRDTLYTNKPLAVLREYGANAWDAHRMVGKGDVPIKVVLPTELDSSLTIRDWGPGLSEYDVANVYTQYGASTKRDSNETVGMLGIGSKSAFAYNDSFTVTSYHGGLKRVFHAVLDKTNKGETHKFFEGALGKHLREYIYERVSPEELSDFQKLGIDTLPDDEFIDLDEYLVGLLEDVEVFQLWMAETHPDTETGIEIKVPVNPQDIPAFIKESERLFRHFRPMPIINIPLVEPPSTWQNEHGHLRRAGEHQHEDDWIAVMGCVPYRLNLDQVWSEIGAKDLSKQMGSLRGALYFDIGEVDVVASREELEYRQRTKDAIANRFERLAEALTVEIDNIIKDETLDNWNRRLRIRDFVATTGTIIPEEHKDWKVRGDGVTLYTRDILKDKEGNPVRDEETHVFLLEEGPQTFTLKRLESTYSSGRGKSHLSENPRVPITHGTRLLIKDTLKPARGYIRSPNYDLVVSIKGGHTLEQVRAEVLQFLKSARLEGIPIFQMSEMVSATSVKQSSSGRSNQKHKETCFKLRYRPHNHTPYSNNWQIESRSPDQDDVYLIINRFVPEGKSGQFFYDFEADRKALKDLFGEDMPPIYGIKTTAKRPVREEDVEGTPYHQWRVEVFREGLEQHPDILEAIEAKEWLALNVGSFGWKTGQEHQTLKFFQENLDGRHRIVRLFKARAEARKLISSMKAKKDSLNHLIQTLKLRRKKSPANHALKKVYGKYPLLKPNDMVNTYGMAIFSCGSGRSETKAHWLQYINLIDNDNRRK